MYIFTGEWIAKSVADGQSVDAILKSVFEETPDKERFESFEFWVKTGGKQIHEQILAERKKFSKG